MNKPQTDHYVSVLGAGFAGISAATVLADQGCHVGVYEKNESAGGRSRKFTAQGFTFCLLYTSPSPRDQRGSRMPSSA